MQRPPNGWSLPNTPQNSCCGTYFSVDHAMFCHMGGIPTIHHDITASLLGELCHNVGLNPLLQSLTGESFSHHSAIIVDIHAQGFWSTSQDAFFDVRVFHSNTPSNSKNVLGDMQRHCTCVCHYNFQLTLSVVIIM